jgi:hypothetical protein
MRAPAFWNIDASIFRRFPFAETRAVEFRAEAFNMPNTVIFQQPGSNFSDKPNFGVVSGTANSARIIQFALKVVF